MTNKRLFQIMIAVLIAGLMGMGVILGLSSCNVTRVVTTQCQYFQRGDTSVTITTKTTETYDATKR